MRILKRINYYFFVICRNIVFDKFSQEFIKHCRAVWNDGKVFNNSESEILFEQNNFHSAVIAYSYLANLLAKKYRSRVTRFRFPSPRDRFGLDKLTKHLSDKIFISFNANKLLVVSPNKKQKREATLIFDKIYPTLNNTRDVENLTIDGVWVGDLIYDSFLMEYGVPTINLSDRNFVSVIKKSLGIFVFWRDYLNSNIVKAVNVSHCVYNVALLLRLAVMREIPVFQINATHAYRLDVNNLFAYVDFYNYREIFKTLPSHVQQKGLEKARERIERRFAGEVGVDMPYSTKSAYAAVKTVQLLKTSDRQKILIALHCFFDSPHSYGVNLFPDFYEWLDFLGSISEETDYDWYLKRHPDVLPGNEKVVDYFLRKYPKFVLLPQDSSHHQIIKEGINVALTVFGTIGFEYAALGVPVINASACNPHVAYDFNIHPKSVEEYGYILRNLKSLDVKIDRDEVYEYYFMNFIYNTENWLFNDYSKMIKTLGGYSEQFTPRVYDYFLREWSVGRHKEILETLENFVESGDFRLRQVERAPEILTVR